MNEDQIKYMISRFLQWRLAETFNPDGGISFIPTGNTGTPHEYKHNPVGTNLFDCNQAEAMIRYLVEGMPSGLSDTAEIIAAHCPPQDTPTQWISVEEKLPEVGRHVLVVA